MAWSAHIQQVLLAHHTFMNRKFKNDAYEVFMNVPTINDESFFTAINHSRSYYYSGHDKTEIKNFLKIVISKYDNKHEIIKKMEIVSTITEFNIIIYSLVFKSCISLRMIHFYKEDYIIKQIALGMKHKEMVLAAMELFDTTHKYINLKQLCNVLWYLLKRTDKDNNILLYNYLTYFIPNTKRLFSNDGLVTIYKANLKHEQFVKKIQIHLAINGYEEDTISCQYLRDDDPEIKALIFQLICKVPKRLKKFTLNEVIFIMEYLKSGDINVIKQYFPYFISHFVVLANTSIKMKEPRNCDFVRKLHKLSIYLLFSGIEDKINIGGYIYVEVYKTVCMGQLKSAYSLKSSDIYGPRRNPLYLITVLGKDWAFGEPEDIDKFIEKINTNNFNSFFHIFDCLEFPQYIIDVDELYKLYKNFLCRPILHIDEKMALFVKFFINHYSSEIAIFLNKLLETTFLGPLEGQINYAYYSNLRAISIYINEKGDSMPEEMKLEIRDKAVEYLNVLLSTHSHTASKSHIDFKFGEKMIAYCIDIIVEIYRTSTNLTDTDLNDVKCIINKGLSCNMRFAVTHIAETFRKFVQTKSEKHYDFFYEYLIHKAGTMTSQMDINSRLRRSTEFRLIIHSICCGIHKEKRKEFLEGVIKYMISLHMTSFTKNVDSCIVILHSLQHLIQENILKEYTINFIEYIILLCLHNMGNSNFRLSNATYLLFEAAVNRILPSQNSHNNMCLSDVLTRFPQIHNLKHYLSKDHLDSVYTLQSKVLLLQFLQRADNNNVLLFSSENSGIILIPIALNFISEEFSLATPFFMKFVVHITPHSTLPYLYDWLSSVIEEKLATSDMQMTYTFLNAVELLLEKYAYFLKINNIKYSQRYLKKITSEFRRFKFEQNVQQLKAAGLVALNANSAWFYDNPEFAILHIDLDYCPNFLSQLFAKPEAQKLDCVNSLLLEVSCIRDPQKQIKYLSFAVNLMLTLECIEIATPVLTNFITLFHKNKYHLPKDAVDIEGKEILFLSKHKSNAYLVFIVKIIEACKSNISPELEEYILYSYMVPGDINIMRTVLGLENITKDRVGVLISFSFILILTPYHYNGVLMQELHSRYPKLTGKTFSDTIDEVLSLSFLRAYFNCKEDIFKFYKRFRTVLDCLEFNGVGQITCQYNLAEIAFSQIALTFIDI